MNRCDWTRDSLPGYVRGELADPATAVLTQHLAGCEECAADERVVRLLQASLDVPPGLEGRVLMHVRRPVAAPRWYAPRRLAMAATIAGALLGGLAFIERYGDPATTPDLTMDADGHLVSWAAAEDPLLHGPSFIMEYELPQLTDEELEQLLAELDS